MCLAHYNQHLQTYFVMPRVAISIDPISSNISRRNCFSILEQVVDEYNFFDLKTAPSEQL